MSLWKAPDIFPVARRISWIGLFILIGCGSPPALPDNGGLRELNGTQLFVREMGSGDAVIVIHGGPLLEHGYLLPHLEPLADDYRLVFYDQRLSGRSSAEVDSSEVTIAAFVEDIEALRRSIGEESVHLLAHSWGGHLAMQYAIAHPERVRRMILSSPMAASTALWQAEGAALGGLWRPEHAAARESVLTSDAFQRGEPGAIEALMRISYLPQMADPSNLDRLELFFPEDYGTRSGRFGALTPELVDFDLHEALSGVDVETLVLFGEIELGAEIGGTAIVAAMPRARLVTLPGTGHFQFLERPELFLSQVREFLGG